MVTADGFALNKLILHSGTTVTVNIAVTVFDPVAVKTYVVVLFRFPVDIEPLGTTPPRLVMDAVQQLAVVHDRLLAVPTRMLVGLATKELMEQLVGVPATAC